MSKKILAVLSLSLLLAACNTTANVTTDDETSSDDTTMDETYDDTTATDEASSDEGAMIDIGTDAEADTTVEVTQ